MGILNLIIIPISISFLVSYLATPYVIRFAKNYGLVDDPKKKHPKKLHKHVLPRAGGFAILFGVLSSTALLLPLDKHMLAIMIGCTLVVLVGLLDDKYDLSPWLRLTSNFLCASIPIAAGIGIAYISSPLGGVIDISHPQIQYQLLGEIRSIWILSDIFALFWIVILMNFINMGAKGIQGQLPGTVAIASIFIAILSFSFSADIAEWPVTILAAITAGAFLGFLPWNFFPQKIMPGYSGSTLGGYLLAILAILTTTKVGVLMVVLAVPIIDTSFVILNRIRRGKSPLKGDTTHLHHRLLSVGLNQKQVVFFYWVVSTFLGVVAIGLNTFSKYSVLLVVGLLIAGLIFVIDLYLKLKDADRSN